MQMSLSRARVVVTGDLMLDRYWHGDCQRISPEAPVPVVGINTIEDRAGGAANVAANLATLGATVTLVGALGNDDAGHSLQQLIAQFADTDNLHRSSSAPTTTKLRVISRHQQLVRLDFEARTHQWSQSALLNHQAAALTRADTLVLSDYAKGVLSPARPFIEQARAQKATVIVDPKLADLRAYAGATLLTPNLHEFRAAVGACEDESHIAQLGERLATDLGLQALLVTRGDAGMSLIRPGHPARHLPAQSHEVFDVTGAGDTVIATLAAAIGSGMDLETAVRYANVAAGIAVQKFGTATVSAEELGHALTPEPVFGVLTPETLSQTTAAARARGERIVMTNGCFDLLHEGHVRYLQEARALGDRLIVAVNDDASVARLKGPTRPIVPCAQRMAVLAALRDVDWVVPFSADTPIVPIVDVQPDVLVKGGDYHPDHIVGAAEVRTHGGCVQVLSFAPGRSTSALVDKIHSTNAN